MTEEKERIEKKLEFLKESLKSGIISEEEYKQREQDIEKELNNSEKKEIKEVKEETEKKEEPKEEIKIQEIKEEKLKEIEEKKEDAESKEKEEKQEETKKKIEEKPEAEIKEEEIKELQDKEKPDKKKKSKLIIFSILILIIFLIFYFYAFKEANKEKDFIEFKPECISDNDCEMQDKMGICLNPNTTEAKCEFKEDKKVTLTIVNDKDCSSCDTTRMFNVIKQLFPLVKKTGVDYNSEEGKKLIEELNIETLPSYIFEYDLKEAYNFDKFKRALISKENKFIINSAASGASYYFKRSEIKNELNLFMIPSTTSKVEDNVQEVLNLFEDKISYSKYVVSSEKEKKKLNNELGITTYPTFLINNQLKFTGIQPPEFIKNKFCEMNKLPGCEVQLSKDIK